MTTLHPLLAGSLAALCIGALAVPFASAQCGELEVTPVPFGSDWKRSFLYDVSALAPDDAWAVGFYDLPDGPFGSDTFSLAMHWDGSSWTQTPTQNPSPYPGGTAVSLHGVAAVAPDDVWAGGERHGDAGGLSVGAWIHVQHWDGRQWETVPVPEPPGGSGINFSGTRIYEVLGFASDDVWFGGAWAEPNELFTTTWRPLAMHWDGSSMEIFDTPAIYDGTSSFGFAVRSFSALAPDDIYALCTPNTAQQASKLNALLHWDGSEWTLLEVPSTASSRAMKEVVAIAPDDVWLLGNWYFPVAPYALHFDGGSWTEISGSPLLSCAAAAGPGTIYTGSDVVSIFDGAGVDVVGTFGGVVGPSVLGLRAAGECSLWAVGRQSIGGVLLPLAARLEGGAPPSPWAIVPGGVAGGNGTPPLTGDGPLLAGSSAGLALSGAMPGTSTTLVLGLAELGAAFKGGVLVPTPDVLVPGLVTDARGEWSLSFSWPAALPSGASVWFQVWMQDGAGALGFAASDGLRATQP